jgi:hypothetical protein
MDEELNTKISVADLYGRQKVANMTLEDAKFWGRPNFKGELDRFNDSRRKFTVLIPEDIADTLAGLGWNIRRTDPKPEQLAINPEMKPVYSLKVFMNFTPDEDDPENVEKESGPNVYIVMGGETEKLNSRTVGLLDRARIDSLDMEIRAWEYNKLEHPGKFSARLVELVAVIRPSILGDKYGLGR